MVKIHKKYLSKRLVEFLNEHDVQYITRNDDTDYSEDFGNSSQLYIWKEMPLFTKGMYHRAGDVNDGVVLPSYENGVPFHLFQLDKGDIVEIVD
jgi:hypothetical protein